MWCGVEGEGATENIFFFSNFNYNKKKNIHCINFHTFRFHFQFFNMSKPSQDKQSTSAKNDTVHTGEQVLTKSTDQLSQPTADSAPDPAPDPTTTSSSQPSTSTTTAASSKAKQETKPSSTDDVDDLDDLLDDFADDVLSKPPGSTIENQSQTEKSNATAGVQRDSETPRKDPTNPLGEDFQKSIAELMKDMNIEDPETQEQFATLVSQFETEHREEVEKESAKPANFEYVMKETMERLRKSGEDIDSKIKNDHLGSNPEDLLTQLLAGMGENGLGGAGDMDMSKLLVEMLEQLSSKEVLYEPIKDLNQKFPEYLKENKDKLESLKYDNYNKQYEITQEIVDIFESKDYSDANKQQRDQVNTLLESLQELGQPPVDLVGEGEGFLPGLGGGGGAAAAGGVGGNDAFAFNDKDLPPNFEKNLQEGCQQQ